MCLGIPMQVIRSQGIAALCRDGDHEEQIDISLVGAVADGTWVLTFLGAAREVIDAGRAAEIRAALDGLRSLMAGGDLGDAFADLEQTGPRLPPHLQTAHASGKTII